MFTRSSKHRAGSSRPIGIPLPGSNVGLGLGYVHINTSTSPALRIPVYEFRQTRVCLYFNGGRSHTYDLRVPCKFHSYK